MECKFQRKVIQELQRQYPGAIILKNDPNYIQGIPDLTMLWRRNWALLEVKDSIDAPHQPNQSFYVDAAFSMSYGAFVYPENFEEVRHEIQQAFKFRR